MPIVQPEQRSVQRSHQRRALPPGRDVATAEIGDYRDARRLGEPRGVGKLCRVSQLGTMTDRLAMDADRDDLGARDPGLPEHGGDRAGAAVHQRVRGKRRTMYFVFAGALQRVQLAPERVGERNVCRGNAVR